jgi:Api92-like protein with ferredoxin domain
MPNWFVNIVSIKGSADELARFRSTHIVPDAREDEGQNFDFNTIIPMPEALKGSECSSVVSDGLAILGVARQHGRPSLQEMLNWPCWKGGDFEDFDGEIVTAPTVTTIEELRAQLLKQSPDCVEKAQRFLALYEATGYGDWYDWSVANWGDKWNACRFQLFKDEPNEIEFVFHTPWAPPKPVFARLCEMYPALTFTIKLRHGQ